MIPISHCFYAKFRWERDIFTSFYAYIVAYLCFQGEPSGSDEKDSFQEELKEE